MKLGFQQHSTLACKSQGRGLSNQKKKKKKNAEPFEKRLENASTQAERFEVLAIIDRHAALAKKQSNSLATAVLRY